MYSDQQYIKHLGGSFIYSAHIRQDEFWNKKWPEGFDVNLRKKRNVSCK